MSSVSAALGEGSLSHPGAPCALNPVSLFVEQRGLSSRLGAAPGAPGSCEPGPSST